MKQNLFISLLTLLLMTSTASGIFAQADPEELWEQGNQAYTAGNYPEAIQLYDSISRQGYASARLFYNLGNAYYKENQIGRAILYYNRAQRLDPGNADIRHNLSIAGASVRDRIDVVPEFFLKTWSKRLMYTLGGDTWAVLSLVFFGFALALVLLYLLGTRTSVRKAGFYGAILCLALAIGTLLFASIQRRKLLHPDEAIVMITAAPVKSEPNQASRDVFVLHEGTKVRIDNSVGEWREIVLSDGNRGWIEQKSIALIE
jgi:tetratricopeptide (TPR) repeat protein